MSEEKKIRNILITSIMRDEFKDDVKYYYYEYGEQRKFGCRVARSEAAAYTVLSQTRLDEIIAIGRDTDINEGDVLEKVTLASMDDLSPDTNCMSDYAFFKYRLCEYINGVDFEASDIYESVPKERQKDIVRVMRHVLGEDLSRGFKQLFDEFDLLKKIYEEAGICSRQEKNLVKNYLFVNMRKEDKIFPSEENKGIQISYLPIIKTDDKYGVVTNAQKLVDLLNPNTEERLNLFVDLQGFSLADGYTLFNLLSLLDIDSKYNVAIQSVTSLSDRKDMIAQRLSDVSSRYRSSELISGIQAFVNYGQSEIITNYWRKTGIKNDYIDEFLYAMSMVDTGISLCNNEELIAGIKKAVACSKDENRANNVDLSMEETQFLMQIRHAVLTDYADLVDDDGNLDLAKLIKWEYQKGYYQQAMTIIESKTPEILSNTGALYYARNEEDKQKMLVYLNDKYWRESPRFRWGFNDISHWLVKSMPREYAIAKHEMKTPLGVLMARVIIKGFEDETSCGIKLYTVATDMHALEDLLACYYDMGTLRNSVNHAQKQNNGEEEDEDYTQMNPVLKGVSAGIKSYINKLDKVLEDVKGKEFTSVLIGDEERTSYINEHKFYADNDDKYRGGRGRYNRGPRDNSSERHNGGQVNGQNGGQSNGESNTQSSTQTNAQTGTQNNRQPSENRNQRSSTINVEKDLGNIHIYIDLSVNGQNVEVTPKASVEPSKKIETMPNPAFAQTNH